MSDFVRSVLRTAFPVAWGSLVAWLVTLGLPASVTDTIAGFGQHAAEVVIAVVVYAVVRWIEPHIPDWLTRVLLGSAKPPTYGA